MQALLTAVRPFLSQALLPSVVDKLFHGLCSALGLMPAPVPGLLHADKVQHPTNHSPDHAWAVGRNAHCPDHRAPSNSSSTAEDGESAPDAAEEHGLSKEQRSLRNVAPHQPAACPCQLPTTQSLGKLPRPTAASPGTGLQRGGKGSLTALPVGLDCGWRSQVRALTELQVKDCYLPLVQITALLSGTSSRAQQAMLLPGLRWPLEVSSTARLNTEIHRALS